MNDAAHLATWVTNEQKQRFGVLARHQGLSDSALLRRLVELALRGASVKEGEVLKAEYAGSRAARLYVRLRAEDRLLLGERAASRSMRAATYVSVLVRAHLRSLSPLPKDELVALKRSVAELGAIGRNLNQVAIAANQGGRFQGPSKEDLRAFLQVCTALRDHVKGLIKANLNSWQSGHAEAES